jgi:predicted transcriptional regulator
MFLNDTKHEAESKLLLLYIIDKFEITLTNNQITEFIMENELLNYFMLQQFLSELVDSALLEYIKNEDYYYYLITEKGKNTLNYFKDRLSKDLLEKIDVAVEKRKKVLLKETQISANYIKKSQNDYIVELKVVENDITLFDLKLDVVSNKQAKLICDKWKKKAQDIYGDIIKLLIE